MQPRLVTATDEGPLVGPVADPAYQRDAVRQALSWGRSSKVNLVDVLST